MTHLGEFRVVCIFYRVLIQLAAREWLMPRDWIKLVIISENAMR